MIGRLILTYPDASRRLGSLLVLTVIALGLYQMGISAKWLGQVLPISDPWLSENPAGGRVVSSVLIALIAAVNWKLLRLLPRAYQIGGVWIELFVLLMLFFYSFDLSLPFIAKKIGFLITRGVTTTLYISAISIAIATIVALLGAIAKLSRNGVVYGLATFYTSLFRALPELLTLMIIYFGLPLVLQAALANLGITTPVEINPFVAGMIAIGIVFSSYCSEVLLSAFRAIPHGQYEGGYAIGLTPWQTMRLIVLPQLIRIALPGLGNLWMVLLKDTALVSAVGLPDILRQTFVAAKVTKHAFTFTGIACLLFLALAILSSFVINWLEAYTKRAEARR